jgi:predicted DNA binding protein
MRYLVATVGLPEWMLHPMQEFMQETDAIDYEELLTWNFKRGSETEVELFYVVGDVDPYREAIEDVDGIREYTIEPVDDRSFYVYAVQETRPEDLTFRTAWGNPDIVVIPPIRFEPDASIRVTMAGDVGDFQEVVERLPEGFDVEIEEVGTFDRPHATVAGALTDRQYQAVETAVELGYYETPRDASLESVAEALDCAPSTASNHLQKAEATVLRRIVRP